MSGVTSSACFFVVHENLHGQLIFDGICESADAELNGGPAGDAVYVLSIRVNCSHELTFGKFIFLKRYPDVKKNCSHSIECCIVAVEVDYG